jgi:hypothetical protein
MRSTKILPQTAIQKREKIPLVERDKVVTRRKNDITQKEKQTDQNLPEGSSQ